MPRKKITAVKKATPKKESLITVSLVQKDTVFAGKGETIASALDDLIEKLDKTSLKTMAFLTVKDGKKEAKTPFLRKHLPRVIYGQTFRKIMVGRLTKLLNA